MSTLGRAGGRLPAPPWAGPLPTTLVARASAHAVAVGGTLRESLLGVPELAGWVDGAGVTSAQIDAALDPAGYLGSAGAFTDAALAAHARRSLPRQK